MRKRDHVVLSEVEVIYLTKGLREKKKKEVYKMEKRRGK